MITFAPTPVSVFQNPVCDFLAAIIARRLAAQPEAALSRPGLPDKPTSLCSRQSEDPGSAVPANAVSRAHTAGAQCDVNIDDWNIMFGAVTKRLVALIGDQEPAASTDPQASQKTDRLRAEVLDCVDALERLRWAMTHEPLPRRAPGSGVSP